MTDRRSIEIEVIRELPPRLARCSAAECQRRIEWVTTLAGKRMPVDAPLVVVREHARLDDTRVTVIASASSHFATCSAASRFSRGRR